MKAKLKNKIDKETGRFLCHRCGKEVRLGVIIKGYVYDLKCGQIIKGKRDENGLLLKTSGRKLLQPEVEKPTSQLAPGRARTPPVKREPLLQPSPVVSYRPGAVTGHSSANEISERVATLTSKGLSSREIANSLKKEGISISHMTVSRMQNKLKQGVLF